MTINIQPLAVQSVTVLELGKCTLHPNNNLPSAQLEVQVLLKNGEQLFDSKTVLIGGSDYERWRKGSERDLEEIILRKLGATRVGEPIAVPASIAETLPDGRTSADEDPADHASDCHDAGDEHQD